MDSNRKKILDRIYRIVGIKGPSAGGLKPGETQRLQEKLNRLSDQMVNFLKTWRFEPCVIDDIEIATREPATEAGLSDQSLGRLLARIEASRAKANALRGKLIEANLRLVVSMAKRYLMINFI